VSRSGVPCEQRSYFSSVLWWLIAVFSTAVLSLAQNSPPVEFTDITTQTHIDFAQENSATSNKYLIETMGGGVALFDYDNDGRLDVFLTNGALLSDPMPDGAATALATGPSASATNVPPAIVASVSLFICGAFHVCSSGPTASPPVSAV